MGRKSSSEMTDAQPERDLVAQLRRCCKAHDAGIGTYCGQCIRCRAADELAELRECLQYAEMTIAQCRCDESNVTMSFDEFRGMENELAALRAARDTLSRCYTDADAKCADLTAKCERLEADLDALRENEKTVAENLSTILSKGNASTWEQIYHAANDLIARNVEVLDRCIDLERYKTDAINLTAKCERLSDNLLIRTRELEDRTAELERSKEEIAYNELRWMEHMTLVRNDLEAQRDKAVAALEMIPKDYPASGPAVLATAVLAEIREGERGE